MPKSFRRVPPRELGEDPRACHKRKRPDFDGGVDAGLDRTLPTDYSKGDPGHRAALQRDFERAGRLVAVDSGILHRELTE